MEAVFVNGRGSRSVDNDPAFQLLFAWHQKRPWECHMMWIMLAVAAVLALAAGGIYLLLKSMGQNGIEAAAPGSCRSGRCGVTATNNPAPAGQVVLIDEITRKDARSPDQTL
ncbi:MAG: hypothetical protein IPG66_00760 [Hydrogenophilales bacterium]|nr:hypothetical protein [Hydrogenophilales bacterium]